MRFYVNIFFLTLLLSGCGGGSSNEMAPLDAPVASNFILRTDASGQVSSEVQFTDPEGDIVAVSIVILDADGVVIVDQKEEIIDLVGGTTSGTIAGNLDFSTLSTGEYLIELFFTDSVGNESNRVSCRFSVSGGFGRDVNYPNPYDFFFLGDTAVGDLNGDGRKDVVSIQGSNNTGKILIYYQTQSGIFGDPIALDLNVDTRGVAIADVNSDGKDDLVVSGLSRSAQVGYLGRVMVFLQEPSTGYLLQPQEYGVESNSVFSLAIADLNSDGRNDIAVMAPQVGIPGNVSIFFQDANGALGPEVIYNKVTPLFDGEIHIADMDNDGKNDIVIQSGQKELAVIRQIAPGVFMDTPEFYTVVTSYWPQFSSFALGDLNGDGRTDIVAVEPGNNNYVNIFYQNPQGLLNSPSLLQIEDSPFGVEIADITGDGLNDIVSDISGGVVVLPQNNDHTFATRHFYGYQAKSYGGSSVHQSLSVGDVTGDGKPDAVLTWSDEGLYVLPYSALVIVK